MMLPKVPERVPRVGKLGVQTLGIGRAQPVYLATETFAVRRPASVILLVEPAKDEQRSRQNGGESKGESVCKKAAGVLKLTLGNIANRLRRTEAIMDRDLALGMMKTESHAPRGMAATGHLRCSSSCRMRLWSSVSSSSSSPG
jgi:hypothetical protein